MKATKIVMTVVIALVLIRYASLGFGFKLPMILPFMGGSRPAIYEIGGVVIILITIWGLRRLGRHRDND